MQISTVLLVSSAHLKRIDGDDGKEKALGKGKALQGKALQDRLLYKLAIS